ncbi:hypothetical protein BHC47_10265 [Snodgrassella alvi]|uniref:AAA+ ATPase domain-containing protein n=1 Tax=Snodgrassella alvi TaxID=1196083 RepID=A0A2N9Y6E3_9NEIS|nr:AAA family ATPase [Snodgrassella alvi]PIT64368.1 hypothetical protein BHC47_10265 [Snodgrassella alvi]PIT65740.1 hypothetical protein BHC56_10285 [Snodgrassella alvi]
MNNTKQNYWFLEANNNRSDIFIRNNEWIYAGNNKKDIEQIHLIAAGDQVAIKSVSPQISDLPFENKGYPVPITQIKAIGTVIENPGDGKSLKVSWQKSTPEKKWYFYTSLKTIWPINKDTNWQSEQLINFTFNDQPQDIDQFCQMPYWQERFNNTNYDPAMNNQNQQKLNNNARWQTTVHYLIQELCEKNNSSIFTRQQFLQEYEQLLQERFPKNNTIGASVSRTFQELSDKDILIFLNNNGQYKLVTYDSDMSNKNNISSEENPDQKNIPRKPYLLDDLIEEGCFISKDELESIQTKLKEKKNIILQGPPGTGKTWLAKRLASVIVGYRDSKNIKAIQFHPNTSYEDFIRGYRPSSDGKLELVDGPFLNIANQAENDPDANYVIVIEEINRGNPAQIFGEMLTLLEASKRNPQEALELTYGDEKEGFFIPDNLYVIGTMNIADRSLAMVDFALRRRFAFFDLKPNFGNEWLKYMNNKTKISIRKLNELQKRIDELNKIISADQTLGSAFTIGHSYLTTSQRIVDNKADKDKKADKWFTTIVKTEIMPLLKEYWFDKPDQFEDAEKILLP